MCDSLPNSKPTGWFNSFLSSSRYKTIQQHLNNGTDLLLIVEPGWILLATTLVFISYLLQIEPTFLPWIGLMLAFLPFPLRWIRQGSLKISTPFDIPFTILICGALVGVIVSPKLSLSLGVFQCILATSLFYYSWVNYHHLSILLKLLLALFFLCVLGEILFTHIDFPLLPNPYFSHGIAISMLVIALIITGMTIFRKGITIRIAQALLCVGLYLGVFFLTEDSIKQFFAWISINGRIPLWQDTIAIMGNSFFSGFGLGCWALTYHGTEAISSLDPTHVHNAYLELYVNYGILGALAFVISFVVFIKLAIDIIRSPRNHPWYGFGIGVILACLAVILLGIVESSPIGVSIPDEDTYYYLISPAPWIMAGFLVSAQRLLSKKDP